MTAEIIGLYILILVIWTLFKPWHARGLHFVLFYFAVLALPANYYLLNHVVTLQDCLSFLFVSTVSLLMLRRLNSFKNKTFKEFLKSGFTSSFFIGDDGKKYRKFDLLLFFFSIGLGLALATAYPI